MDNKKFAAELEERTKQFAINIIRLCSILPTSTEAIVLRRQLVKSGTSIGANYREANRARSKADFKSKIRICESEASETQYWLEIIKDLKWLPDSRMKEIFLESKELLAIFSTIGAKLNRK